MQPSRIDEYRQRDRRIVAGVMSGTSLDGVDVALVEIGGSGPGGLSLTSLGFCEYPLHDDLRHRLEAACTGELPMRELFELDADLGAYYAETVERTIEDLHVHRLDAIGLHGQTVYHAPRRSPHGVTTQIGSAAEVAVRLRTLVVSDFRRADVAVGGEGAPLVPYCDYVLLRSADHNRVALNIGGIANITWLPKHIRPDRLLAFDTGPGNMMIDAAMAELYGERYDRNGRIARSGRVDRRLLDELLSDSYFEQPPPKSSGRERFGVERTRAVVARGRDRGLSPEDIVATLTSLTARTIAQGVRMVARGDRVDQIVVGGGGLLNRTMIRMLEEEIPGAEVIDGESLGLPYDAKEAICFALLAHETLLEVPTTFPSVTGASRPVISGSIRIG